MRRLAALSVFGFGLATVAVAESDMDCGRAYKGMLTTIERKKPTPSAEAQVALQRTALRIYDACLTGMSVTIAGLSSVNGLGPPKSDR